MPDRPDIFDEDLWRRRKDRIVTLADGPDFLLARVADDMAERLSIINRRFQHGACLGAYSGQLARRLRLLTNVGQISEIESAELLLARADGPRICAALDIVPFEPERLDLVVSALALQLINDLPGVMAQARRALRPDGLALMALLGGDTLKELREAWLVAEAEITGGASPRVAPFADVRALGALLQRAGFALPVADSDTVRVTYASPLALMHDIKAMGASNVMIARRRVPVTRRLLQRAADVYTQRFALPDGRVPATFEIITLTGWVPHESQPKPLAPGSAKMRLADALKANPKDREAKE